MYNSKLLLLCIIFSTLSVYVFSQNNTQSPQKQEIDTYETQKKILQYGISDNVVKVIKQAIQSKDMTLKNAILNLFSQRNIAIKTAVLNYANAIQDTSLETTILEQLTQYSELDTRLIVAFLIYLQKIEKPLTEQSTQLMIELSKDLNPRIQIAAITNLGINGNETASTALETLYAKEDNDTIRITIIRAIGNLKTPPSSDTNLLLLSLIKNEYINKDIRYEAIQSVGKLQIVEALPLLLQYSQNDDPSMRKNVLDALGYYKTGVDTSIYLDALRDSFWQIRISALKIMGEQKNIEALPYIYYITSHDPENTVQKAALQSLTHYNTQETWNFLIERAQDNSKQNIQKMALYELLTKNMTQAHATVENLLNNDNNSFNTGISYFIARTLSTIETTEADNLYIILLRNSNESILKFTLQAIRKNKRQNLAPELQYIIDNNKSARNARILAENILKDWGIFTNNNA